MYVKQRSICLCFPQALEIIHVEVKSRDQSYQTPSYKWYFCAGILEQSMGARYRVGIGLSYRPARLERLADRQNNSVPNWFLAPIDCFKTPAISYIVRASQPVTGKTSDPFHVKHVSELIEESIGPLIVLLYSISTRIISKLSQRCAVFCCA